MYFPRFKAISNKGDWTQGVRLRDKNTKALIDITNYTFEMVIYREDECRPSLSASTADGTGKLTKPDANTILWTWRKSDFACLYAGTYRAALRVILGADTDQIFIATLPIFEGGFAS